MASRQLVEPHRQRGEPGWGIVVPQPDIEREGVTLVLLGSFNPAIFQPKWLATQGLISASAADAAIVELMTTDVTIFRLEWCDVQILADRLTISSTSAPTPDLLRDLALGIFRLLVHTPVRAIGINKHAHMALGTAERWHSFGHRIAPKPDIWDFLKEPGTLTLTVRGERDDGHSGSVNVKVEPSTHFENSIFVETNDEFHNDSNDDAIVNAEWVVELLEKEWETVMDRASTARQRLFDLAFDGIQL